MAHMFITETQARALLAARTLTGHVRKSTKRSIMQQIHKDHPAIGNQKIVLFIENPDNPYYAVIRSKRTKLPLDDGKQAALPAPKAKAPAKKVAAKKPAAKVAAKKVPAKKAAPVAKKPAAKVAAKKVPAKKAAPVVKKAAPKAVAKKTAAKKR